MFENLYIKQTHTDVVVKTDTAKQTESTIIPPYDDPITFVMIKKVSANTDSSASEGGYDNPDEQLVDDALHTITTAAMESECEPPKRRQFQRQLVNQLLTTSEEHNVPIRNILSAAATLGFLHEKGLKSAKASIRNHWMADNFHHLPYTCTLILEMLSDEKLHKEMTPEEMQEYINENPHTKSVIRERKAHTVTPIDQDSLKEYYQQKHIENIYNTIQILTEYLKNGYIAFDDFPSHNTRRSWRDFISLEYGGIHQNTFYTMYGYNFQRSNTIGELIMRLQLASRCFHQVASNDLLQSEIAASKLKLKVICTLLVSTRHYTEDGEKKIRNYDSLSEEKKIELYRRVMEGILFSFQILTDPRITSNESWKNDFETWEDSIYHLTQSY